MKKLIIIILLLIFIGGVMTKIVNQPESSRTFNITQSGVIIEDDYYPSSMSVTPAASQYAEANRTITVAHNLGYKPAVICYYDHQNSGTFRLMPYNLYTTGFGTDASWFTVNCHVDETNIYIVKILMAYNNVGVSYGNGIYRYYLMKDTAN